MQLAMKMGDALFYDTQITLTPSIFTKLCYYFNMFGLGVKTADLPGETVATAGSGPKAHWECLDLSYGTRCVHGHATGPIHVDLS